MPTDRVLSRSCELLVPIFAKWRLGQSCVLVTGLRLAEILGLPSGSKLHILQRDDLLPCHALELLL